MVRAPSRYNLKKNKEIINRPVARLAGLLCRQAVIDETTSEKILNEKITLRDSELAVDAGHFVEYIISKYGEDIRLSQDKLVTTLDSSIQSISTEHSG